MTDNLNDESCTCNKSVCDWPDCDNGHSKCEKCSGYIGANEEELGDCGHSCDCHFAESPPATGPLVETLNSPYGQMTSNDRRFTNGHPIDRLKDGKAVLRGDENQNEVPQHWISALQSQEVEHWPILHHGEVRISRELLDLLQAVGHHGIDFGYGAFVIDDSHVALAQKLHKELSTSALQEPKQENGNER